MSVDGLLVAKSVIGDQHRKIPARFVLEIDPVSRDLRVVGMSFGKYLEHRQLFPRRQEPELTFRCLDPHRFLQEDPFMRGEGCRNQAIFPLVK